MTYYLFDTGPLLCFAAVPKGPTYLKARYAGRAGIVKDIDRELRGLQNNSDPRVAAAAKIAVTSYGWLKRHEVKEQADLLAIEALRDQIETFRPKPRTKPRLPTDDYGECATIHYARAHVTGAVVVTINDTNGRLLAAAHQLPTVTTVDVLKAMARDKTMTAGQAFGLYKKIPISLDAGDTPMSANDFR